MKTSTISLGIFNLKKHVTKAVIIIFTSLLVFSSCENPFGNVALIKKSVYGDNKSLTLGDALDNYKYFDKTEWSEFTTKQGKEYVNFTGNYSMNNIVFRIQFIMFSATNEYEVSYMGYKFINQSDDEFIKISLLSYNFFVGQFTQNTSLIDDIYANNEITFFSDIKEPKRADIKESSLPDDFVTFLNEFITNPKFQIANINFPLDNAGLDIPAPTKNEWKILTEEDIFDGNRKLEDGINIIQGKFTYENNNSISYILGFPESSLIFSLGFKKIQGNWKLVKFINDDMTAF